MVTVQQLLTEKGPQVFAVDPESTVFEAIKKMADENVGCLVVCERDKPVGIITERHYARNVVLRGRGSPTTKVRDIMDTGVLYARPDQTVEECMAVMTDRRVRHLPVLEEGKLVGIISIGDLVKAIISDQQFLIEQLVQYIHG
jgi:CBS domain-containing protein